MLGQMTIFDFLLPKPVKKEEKPIPPNPYPKGTLFKSDKGKRFVVKSAYYRPEYEDYSLQCDNIDPKDSTIGCSFYAKKATEFGYVLA